MSSLLAEVIIPDYINSVQLSKERRAKYYHKGDKIPKKYDNKKFGYIKDKKNHYHLCELITGEKVIANSRTAGTPKIIKINGNHFYAGFPSYMIRDKIVDTIKESLTPYFEDLSEFQQISRDAGNGDILLSEYPLYIQFNYYDVKKQAQDLDNKRYIYEKCTLDLLQKLAIIPNDNIEYVTKLSSEFFECDADERQLIIKFYSNKK